MLFIFSCLSEEARILFKSIFLLTLIQHKKVTQLCIKYFPLLHAVFRLDGCFVILLPDCCGRNKPIISHFCWTKYLIFWENLKWGNNQLPPPWTLVGNKVQIREVFLSSKTFTEQNNKKKKCLPQRKSSRGHTVRLDQSTAVWPLSPLIVAPEF